jgi:hypothetical protein
MKKGNIIKYSCWEIDLINCKKTREIKSACFVRKTTRKKSDEFRDSDIVLERNGYYFGISKEQIINVQ